jgi:hypothetical protein
MIWWVEKHGTDICVQMTENKIVCMESIAASYDYVEQ